MDVMVVGLAVLDLYISPVPKDFFNMQTLLVNEIGVCPGGDAVNQAITLKKLGVDVSLSCRIGDDDTGHILMDKLRRAGIDLSMVKSSSASRTTTAVALVREDGQRSILNIKGNNHDFCADDLPPLPNIKALSVASIYGLPLLEQDGGLKNLLKKAKEKGITTFADMGSDKFHQGLDGVKPFLPYIDYFMPSIAEAAFLTNGCTPESMAVELCHAGANTLIIKCGAEGVYLYKDGAGKRIPAYQVNAVDTTGAGDTFCAAFISRKIKGEDDEIAARFACAAAALSTEYYGASTAAIDEKIVLRFLRTGVTTQ